MPVRGTRAARLRRGIYFHYHRLEAAASARFGATSGLRRLASALGFPLIPLYAWTLALRRSRTAAAVAGVTGGRRSLPWRSPRELAYFLLIQSAGALGRGVGALTASPGRSESAFTELELTLPRRDAAEAVLGEAVAALSRDDAVRSRPAAR